MNKSIPLRPLRLVALTALSVVVVTGCRTSPRPGAMAPRTGDEIIVAGKFVHTGAPVVTWLDPGGYDAYRVERRFSKLEDADWEKSKAAVKDLSTPNRYNQRKGDLTPEEVERVRGGGWDLPTLQRIVDQFVLHYDVCGTSRTCFKVLQDGRGLSVHFMLDLDGTIYQTLDVKERAWHATSSNSRSVGIEIANMGAYGREKNKAFADWYTNDAKGTVITIPARFGDGGIRTKDFVGRPTRPHPVKGEVQGQVLYQYDFTPQQYDSLVKLTAALCTALPKIQCDYPRDASGQMILKKLPDEELNAYQGVLGHFHIQTNKTDPGPALQWDYVINNARKLMGKRGGISSTKRGATLLLQ